MLRVSYNVRSEERDDFVLVFDRETNQGLEIGLKSDL